MSKFTATERHHIESLVATLSVKKVPDLDIIQEIEKKTGGKTITQREIYNVRNRIKKHSWKWYKALRDDQYSYIHAIKERFDEIFWLQQKHHEIVDSDREPTAIKQNSLIQLHKLNASLFHYFEVIPRYASAIQEDDPFLRKGGEGEGEQEDNDNGPPDPFRPGPGYRGPPEPLERQRQRQRQKEIICYCPEDGIMTHYECSHCGNVWCPEDKEQKQEVCPNKDCMFSLS